MGPIIERELRACSRRKRYYLLRMVFIASLLLFITWTWLMSTVFTGTSGSAAFRAMRMSIVSRSVVGVIAWMVFIAMPLLATVMLSNAISREIKKRTLEILLSTPVTSLQIVMGKIVGSLLQILLLTMITLPLLAIVRVFGGVPWDYVMVSLCITLTTTCLFAAMSLYYSIRNRQSHKVIGQVLLTALLVFAMLPSLISTLNSYQSWQWLPHAVRLVETLNPFAAMAKITTSIMTSDPQGVSVFPWGRHCLIIVCLFLLILLLSTFRLRRTMLNLAAGRIPARFRIKQFFKRLRTKNKSADEACLLTVKGHPIIWKELRINESQRLVPGPLLQITWIGLIGTIYLCAVFFKVVTEPVFHAVFVTGLALIAFIRTATLSAMSISKEKQSRTWSILLTTPIEDADILKMKAKAILRQTSLFWMVIFADVLVFSVLIVLNPISILGVLIAAVPTVLFLIGIGLYFGMRLKSTTTAMAVTFSVPLLLWVICPCTLNFSPLALIAMSVGIGLQDESWIFTLSMTGFSLIPAIVYGVAGLVFFSLAKSSMRKYIFNVSG